MSSSDRSYRSMENETRKEYHRATQASGSAAGYQRCDDFMRTRIVSCGVVPKFNTKFDFVVTVYVS